MLKPELIQEAYALAKRILQHKADAEDAIQDALSTLLTHKNAPNHNSESFRPWFFTVVRNKSIDKLRANKRYESADENKLEAPTKTLYEGFEARQLKQNIELALNKLTVSQREVLLLKDVHDFSYQQIAQILNIPQGSVMSRLHRARLAFQTILKASIS